MIARHGWESERPGRRRSAELAIPELALVVLIGASGSGKSTFARTPFLAEYEVVSSDQCRGLVSDDENDQSATKDAFEVLEFIVGKRLAAGRLTVIDATNVQREARRQVVELAKAHDVLPVAIVFDLPESVCVARNQARSDRDFGVAGGPPAARSTAAIAAGSGPGGIPAGPRPAIGGRGRRGHRCPGEVVHRLPGPARSFRCDRRCARLPIGTGDAAGRTGLRSCSATTTAARSMPFIPRAAGWSSSVTWWTVVRTLRVCSGWQWGWSVPVMPSRSRGTTSTN